MSKIVLITGPSGAGKTTVSKQLLKSVTGEWAYINQDEIRQLVVVGYASADGREGDWNPETKRQWKASIPICVDIATRYQKSGISCVVDFYSKPNEFLQREKYLSKLDYQLFVLKPDVDTVLNRNSGRKHPSKLEEEKVKQAYRPYKSWDKSTGIIIDSSRMTAYEVAEKIRLLLKD